MFSRLTCHIAVFNLNSTDREYKNLDDLHEALRSREVEGALVDALVAGSRGDLFNSSELRIYKTLHHSSVYGVVLAGHAKKLQKCFSNFLKENSAEVSAHVASKTKVIKVLMFLVYFFFNFVQVISSF